MKSLLLLLLLLLTLPTAARTPEATVREVYDAHVKNKDQAKTIREHRDCFTPGFLQIMLRALAKPSGSANWVDWDFLFNTQDGGIEYEMGRTKVEGREAKVRLNIFQRGDYRNPKPDPNWRKTVLRIPVDVLLSDVGQGFQIHDILFVPFMQTAKDGSKFLREGMSVRQSLMKIANSR